MGLRDKKIEGWSARVVLRYALLQLPAIALLLIALLLVQRWMGITDWIFWGSIIIWTAKDVVLFPFTWQAYDWNGAGRDRSMIGALGITQERLAPSGFIHVRGELWKAEVCRGGRPIEEGEKVEVREIRGLTLRVRPCARPEFDNKRR